MLGSWDVGRDLQRPQRPARSTCWSRGPTSSTWTRRGRCSAARGRAHRDHQHAGRRQLAQRAAAEPDPGVNPYLKNGNAVAQPGRVRDPGAGRVRQPAARRHSAARASSRSTSWPPSASRRAARRTSTCAGRCSTSSTPTTTPSPSAPLQRAGHGREPDPARTALHPAPRAAFGLLTSTVGTHRRPGHEPPGAVRASLQLLETPPPLCEDGYPSGHPRYFS